MMEAVRAGNGALWGHALQVWYWALGAEPHQHPSSSHHLTDIHTACKALVGKC